MCAYNVLCAHVMSYVCILRIYFMLVMQEATTLKDAATELCTAQPCVAVRRTNSLFKVEIVRYPCPWP